MSYSNRLFVKCWRDILRHLKSYIQFSFTTSHSSFRNLVGFPKFALGTLDGGHLLNLIFYKALLLCEYSTLVGRRQVVNIYCQNSHLIDITSGVPQGRHLSLVLFMLFINDLPLLFWRCKYLKYVDHLKIFNPIASIYSITWIRSLPDIKDWFFL